MATYNTVDQSTFKEIGKWTKEKIDALNVTNKVDKVMGKSLVSDTDITQITTNKTNIASLTTKVDNMGGTIQGSCKKTELESKKSEAKDKDLWVVTDDNNHIWMYNGSDFIDTGCHVTADLSNYVTKDGDKGLISASDVAQITTNKTDIASLKTDKADKSSLSSYATTTTVSGIETRVQAIETDLTGLATFLEGVA